MTSDSSGSINSNSIAITNASGGAAAVLETSNDLYEAYLASDNPPSDSAIPLTGFSVLQTADGQQTVSAGATSSFVLTGNPATSDLVFARPADLLPLQCSPLQPDKTSGGFLPVTITADAGKQMLLALQFAMWLQAAPTSNTAAGFTRMLANLTHGDPTADSIEKQWKDFFAGMGEYLDLTMEELAAAQNYMGTYPFAWAGMQIVGTATNVSTSLPAWVEFSTAPVVYYLYAQPQVAPSDGTPGPAVLQGTLTLTPPSSPPQSPSAAASAYTIVYQDQTTSGAAAVTMQYSGGKFVQAGPAGTFSLITLTPLFTLSTPLTNTPTSNATPLVVLAGTANGVQVIGSATKVESSFASFFDPSTFGGWFKLIFTLLAAVGTLATVVKLIGAWARRMKGIKTDIEQLKDAARNIGERIQTLDNARTDAADLQLDVTARSVRYNLQQAVDKMAGQIKELASKGVTDALSETATSLRNLNESLQATNEQTGRALFDAVSQLDPQVRALATQANQVYNQEVARLNNQQKADIQNSQNEIVELQKENAEEFKMVEDEKVNDFEGNKSEVIDR